MTLEEEKKMILEWLGYEPWSKDIHKKKDDYMISHSLLHWNPYKDRNCWPEIWDNMNKEQWRRYAEELFKIFCSLSIMGYWYSFQDWMHIVAPELRWKALLKMLEEV